MALLKNISGELTQEVLAVGDSDVVSLISLVNTHASASCTVDVYIEKKLTGKFYLAKAVTLPIGVTLVLDGVGFNNGSGGFSLFIKLTGSSASTVDVIIN
mgnify:FL=1|tara:strand:+ start:38 stop:337 length:300 start_codon:yes stop_codon:yes gene_type:complete